jgi:2-isopropylmalate synthase
MSSNRLLIYDTTLRDGTQGEGISFSVADKLRITEKLDHFGVDFIEGGFPGSNPRDIAYFEEVRKLKLRHAKIAAFGATRRPGVTAAEDAQLATLLACGVPVVTLVGKSWRMQVTEVLRTAPEENLAMIEDSVRHLVAQGRQVIYDAEHFFDGFADDPEYGLRCVEAALRGGAFNATLCDTNGGRLVDEVRATTAAVVQRFGADKIGVHCHNDSGLGVAVTLAGVQGGAVLVQGTVNGYGERVGNANLVTVLPNLFLKMGCEAHCRPNLPHLRELSLFLDELANLNSDTKAPFVGASAFAHKGGQHANAAQKLKRSYEHIDPALVGNRTRVLVSDMSGRSSVVMKARELGVELEANSTALKDLIEEIKNLEFQGYEYEAADASFQLLIAKALEKHREFFGFEGYRVIVERRGPNEPVISEATVKLRIGGEVRHTVAESNGPIGALDNALRLALEPVFPQLKEILLRDYKVRILESQQGAGARVRVLVETADGEELYGTVGAGENIIEASWQALKDALEFKLLRDEQRKAKG